MIQPSDFIDLIYLSQGTNGDNFIPQVIPIHEVRDLHLVRPTFTSDTFCPEDMNEEVKRYDDGMVVLKYTKRFGEEASKNDCDGNDKAEPFCPKDATTAPVASGSTLLLENTRWGITRTMANNMSRRTDPVNAHAEALANPMRAHTSATFFKAATRTVLLAERASTNLILRSKDATVNQALAKCPDRPISGLSIEHIYCCNRTDLEENFDNLFESLQKNTDLAVEKGIARGSYGTLHTA